MAEKRKAFSISVFQLIFLGIGGIVILLAIFTLGILVGKEIEGASVLEREAKSQVVRMRIEPLRPAQSQVHNSEERSKAMNNLTSKPLITFYDTLMNKKRSNGAKKEGIPKRLYAIQVGAMKDKELADQMASRLKKNGYSAHIISDNSGKNVLYKVRLGVFNSKEDASTEAAKIRERERLSTMVVEK